MTESTEDPETQPGDTDSPLGAAPEAVEVYVCPSCGSWYGSSHAGDLATVPNIRTSLRNLATEDPSEWGRTTGYRIECQHCKGQGKTVNRVRAVFVRVDVIQETFAKEIERAYQEEQKAGHVKLRRPN